MNEPAAPLTPTDLIAASSNVLEAGGYQPIRQGFPEWDTTTTRLFEDKYNVVGVAVFATCAELLRSWADLQGSLVNVIAQTVGRAENKTWDGYLVLLTAAEAPSEDSDVDDVRHDTTRLRKLVATGEDLRIAGDVERLLRPLLPLQTGVASTSQRSALDLLPELLEVSGIGREITAALLKSFSKQKPLMEALHKNRSFE